MPIVTFLTSSEEKKVEVPIGKTVMEAALAAGLRPDAPCGGKGTCGKCLAIVDGQKMPACQTAVTANCTVRFPENHTERILTRGRSVSCTPDQDIPFVLAFDIGTTTVVAYLLDGQTGALLSQASTLNPQTAFGADVISRIQYVMNTGSTELADTIRGALCDLAQEAAAKGKIAPEQIGRAAIVGNTAMHHLLLGIDPKPLTTPPYMPKVYEALEIPAKDFLPIAPDGTVRILPNIAGFVGADTVGCMVSTRFDRLEELTLMIDIGTNGEMVMGDKNHRLACSTAAGPAFEGAKISCGMRGANGAVDHVWLEDGKICYHVIGGVRGIGLCGSGLLDLIAVLLDTGDIEGSGKMAKKEYHLEGTDVVLTQKDVREVQLAKAAIRAGIDLMAKHLNRPVETVQHVYLAGAFGNYMDPLSACRIGMIPPVLSDRIESIGNAAGEGSRLCALSRDEYAYSSRLARDVEFLELASLPEFQDWYVDALSFEEEE